MKQTNKIIGMFSPSDYREIESRLKASLGETLIIKEEMTAGIADITAVFHKNTLTASSLDPYAHETPESINIEKKNVYPKVDCFVALAIRVGTHSIKPEMLIKFNKVKDLHPNFDNLGPNFRVVSFERKPYIPARIVVQPLKAFVRLAADTNDFWPLHIEEILEAFKDTRRKRLAAVLVNPTFGNRDLYIGMWGGIDMGRPDGDISVQTMLTDWAEKNIRQEGTLHWIHDEYIRPKKKYIGEFIIEVNYEQAKTLGKICHDLGYVGLYGRPEFEGKKKYFIDRGSIQSISTTDHIIPEVKNWNKPMIEALLRMNDEEGFIQGELVFGNVSEKLYRYIKPYDVQHFFGDHGTGKSDPRPIGSNVRKATFEEIVAEFGGTIEVQPPAELKGKIFARLDELNKKAIDDAVEHGANSFESGDIIVNAGHFMLLKDVSKKPYSALRINDGQKCIIYDFKTYRKANVRELIALFSLGVKTSDSIRDKIRKTVIDSLNAPTDFTKGGLFSSEPRLTGSANISIKVDTKELDEKIDDVRKELIDLINKTRFVTGDALPHSFKFNPGITVEGKDLADRFEKGMQDKKPFKVLSKKEHDINRMNNLMSKIKVDLDNDLLLENVIIEELTNILNDYSQDYSS